MAIFKPAKGSGGSFFGILPAALIDIVDRSDDKKDDGTKRFNWADIYLDVEFEPKGSQYTRKMQIAGSFERDSNGKITGGSVLNRMYSFFDAIGFAGGVNLDGEWEDKDGNKIDDIEQVLKDYCMENPIVTNDSVYKYLIYVYKEQPRNGSDKVWTRVSNSIFLNKPGEQDKFSERINFLKSRNIIKEYNGVTKETGKFTELSNAGIEAL